MIFIRDPSEIQKYSGKIIFPLSENELNEDYIIWNQSIPILFPNSTSCDFFTIQDNNLVFLHDLLKASFYLLSGYQEFVSDIKDEYGRFRYDQSIQYKLGIINKPIVNYYFNQISEGIEQFCTVQKIRFKRCNLFENFGFLMTHDVDRVDAYNYYEVGYQLKQLLGLSKRYYGLFKTFKVFLLSLFNYINVFSSRNPFWSFPHILDIENKHGIRSVFYFLKNEGKLDSNYSFKELRIKNLITELIDAGCEVGIHGTMNSSLNLESMRSAINELESVCNQSIIGCRQHFLQYHNPQTSIIHEQCNLKYDSTLSFAEHEGFRNSYCLPFKLYNFEKDCIYNVWEYPLNIMEVTLFGYRRLSFDNALDSIRNCIHEIQKFNGLFTVLWHNCFFDEFIYPGITVFYDQLMAHIMKENPQSLTGSELIPILN